MCYADIGSYDSAVADLRVVVLIQQRANDIVYKLVFTPLVIYRVKVPTKARNANMATLPPIFATVFIITLSSY